MSDQPYTGPGQQSTETGSHTGGDPVTSDHAATPVHAEDGSTGGELATRYENPGISPHAYRRSDIDPKAAKRREREVATLFGLSTLGTLLFIVGYFAVQLNGLQGDEMLERVGLSTKLLGLGLGVALFAMGAGAIHWAKTLMPDDEVVNERKPMRSSDDDRRVAIESLKEGAGGAGLGRRKLIRNSLLGAMAPLGLLAIIPLRDLGPMPGAKLTGTAWKSGRRLVTDPLGDPIRAADVRIGEVIHVLPAGVEDMPNSLDEKAKATSIVIRLAPDELKEDPAKAEWSYNGIVAYSKVCTHVGCPVGLYEQQTHHLLCPCHQSTFDVTEHCKVIFGPAARPLPQLPLDVDDEGYLVSRDDFQEPVGPSYWERGERS